MSCVCIFLFYINRNGRFEIIDMIDPLESNIKALPNLEGVSKDFKHFFMLHFNRKETVYVSLNGHECDVWSNVIMIKNDSRIYVTNL